MIYFLALIFCSSALRFNEVGPGSISTLEEQKLLAGGRRRRRKGNGNYYDSPNVEYIIQYPGKRVTDAVKVTAYKGKLAADIATVCLSHLVLTAGVAEAKDNVDKQIKDNLKITAWAISDAGTFTDLVTWPENPGWKTITPVAPSVFDSLFKTTTFTTALKDELVNNKAETPYTGYGVTGDASVVERTVSTSTLTGTLRMELTVSNPAGGPAVTTPLDSFGSTYNPTKAEFQGNSQEFMYEAKEALAATFGMKKDYVTIERNDYLGKMCSTQIMFNFPTTQVAENVVATANILLKGALVDRKFWAIFQTAAATVLNVDAAKIEMATFVSKAALGGGSGIGTTARLIDVQLQYETACTALTGGKIPEWFDEEASRVFTEIGADQAAHLVIAQKIYTEAKKSSPFEVTFGTAKKESDFLALVGKGVNPKHIVLGDITLINPDNLKCGQTGADKLQVYEWANPLHGRATNNAFTVIDMNENWNERDNTMGLTTVDPKLTTTAQYRIKYVIAIKNAVDHNAASLIKSYVAMADGSAESSDVFSVKVKDSMAGATNLLGLGCTVTKVWMKSEATKTLY